MVDSTVDPIFKIRSNAFLIGLMILIWLVGLTTRQGNLRIS